MTTGRPADSSPDAYQFLDLALEAGKRLNDAVPIIKKHVNFHELEKAKRLIEETVPLMVRLREETPWLWERLGLGGTTALRNAIKENACQPLASALVSDLSAILKKYRSEDGQKLVHDKVKGIDRLLLILDDYEMLQEPLGEFLVRHLLPALRSANFQSVVMILGRDQLEATHPAWDQHLKPNLLKGIALTPLSRSEMDQLVESYGVRAPTKRTVPGATRRVTPSMFNSGLRRRNPGVEMPSCSSASTIEPRAG